MHTNLYETSSPPSSLSPLAPTPPPRLMINFTEDTSQPDWKGYLYAVLLFVVAVVQSLLLHQYFHRCFLVGMRVRTAVVAAVYNKVYTLTQEHNFSKSCTQLLKSCIHT